MHYLLLGTLSGVGLCPPAWCPHITCSDVRGGREGFGEGEQQEERDALESLSYEKLGVKGLERARARATYTAPWPSLPSASADRGEGSVGRNHTNALTSVMTPCALGFVSLFVFLL